jgi:ABC-type nitrate/sulfonate/bicarbonate transport system substrate-binding protein
MSSGTISTRDVIGDNLNTARHFVSAVARAIEWSRETPREEVVERLEGIIERRDRGEETADVKHWGSYGVTAIGGVLSEREFQIWIDRLVKAGSLTRGQLTATDLFDNDLNPFASPATAAPP